MLAHPNSSAANFTVAGTQFQRLSRKILSDSYLTDKLNYKFSPLPNHSSRARESADIDTPFLVSKKAYYRL